MNDRFWLTIRFLAFGCLLQSLSQAQQAPDNGNTDELSQTANVASNAIDLLAVPIAELSHLETRIIIQAKTGLIAKDDAAMRMYTLSNAYFDRSEFSEAKRLAAAGVELAPTSNGAAVCLIMFGNLTMIEDNGFERAVKPFQQADSILKALIDKKPSDSLYYNRGVTLNRLGFCYELSNQGQQALKVHKELLESPDIVRCAGDERVLGASLSAGRIAAASGDFKTAQKYFDRIVSSTEAEELSASEALKYLYLRINTLWPKWDDPNRIKELGKLWNSNRFLEDPTIIQVGDDLLNYYFFAVPMHKKEYEKVAIEQLSRIHSIQQRKEVGEDVLLPSRFETIYATCLITGVDFSNAKLDKLASKRLTDEFNKSFDKKALTFEVPANRPFELVERLRSLYQATMSEHTKWARQREDDLKNL